jgi:type I restriction enzyme S subunit
VSGWKEVAAEEYCLKVADGTHDTPKPMEIGEFLITSRHITGGKIDLSNAYRISKKDFEKINLRSKVDKWDVLLTMIGTVGEVVLVDHEPEYAIKNIGLFKCGDELKARWLKYYLQSPDGRAEIQSRTSGTTQEYIALGELRKLPILVPLLSEQRAIAAILSSLDDKIDLLHRQNKTLESLAETLWRKMFVEEANSKWEVGKLEDFGRVVCGKTPSKKQSEYFGGNVPFIKIPDMHDNVFIFETADSLTDEGKNSQQNKTIPAKSICVSCIATVGLVAMNVVDSQTNQQINTIIPNENYQRYFVFLLMRNMTDDLYARASGGTATDNLNTGDFSHIEVTIPPESVIKRFDELVKDQFDRICINQAQIRTLSHLRDTLLPKLMSGEMRVKYGTG